MQGGVHIRDWLKHLIIDIDQGDGFAGDGVRLGHHASQHIADITGRLANANHQRPILLDQADVLVAGDVLSGQHAQHTRMRRGRAEIHGLDERARMIAEFERAEFQALEANIIHITVLPQHQILRVVLGQARTDAAADFGHFDFFFIADGFGGRRYGIDDLLIAGAAAEVRRQAFFDIGAAGLGIAFDERVRLHDDAGNAEAALHTALFDEGVGEDILPIFAQPLGGRHRFAGDFSHFCDAGEQRPVINLHDAAAASRLRRAAILGRDDTQVLAQDIHQGAVGVAIILLGFAVKGVVNHNSCLPI